MYLEQTRSIPRWRCNGIIVSQETGEKCCNGRQIAIRNASFFTHRNLPSYQELQRATLLSNLTFYLFISFLYMYNMEKNKRMYAITADRNKMYEMDKNKFH